MKGDKLVAAVVAGIMSGLAACGGAERPAAHASTWIAPKECCAAKNDCAGKGYCKVAGKNDCRHLNTCRGQGGERSGPGCTDKDREVP